MGTRGATTKRRSTTALAIAALFAGSGCDGCNSCAAGRACASLAAPIDAGPPAETVAAELATDLALGPRNDAVALTTTPRESAAAMPWFVRRPSYAPSLGFDEAKKLYERAGADATGEGMLACELRVSAGGGGVLASVGVTSEPTIRLDTEVDRARFRFVAAGPSKTTYGTIPLVTVERDAPLAVRIGPSTKDALLPLAKTGANLVGGSDGEGITCVLVPRERIEPMFRAALGESTNELGEAAIAAHDGELARVRVKARAPYDTRTSEATTDTTHPLGPIFATVIAETSRLAAYVGWADPRVAARAAWGERIVVHHMQRFAIPGAPPAELPTYGTIASEQTMAPCSREAVAEAFARVPAAQRPTSGCAFRVALTRRGVVGERAIGWDPSASEPYPTRAIVLMEDGSLRVDARVTFGGTALTKVFRDTPGLTLPADKNGFLFAYFDTAPEGAKARAIAIAVDDTWAATAYVETRAK